MIRFAIDCLLAAGAGIGATYAVGGMDGFARSMTGVLAAVVVFVVRNRAEIDEVLGGDE